MERNVPNSYDDSAWEIELRARPKGAPTARPTCLALTPPQEPLWWFETLFPDSAAYNLVVVARVVARGEERLDPGALARALSALASRHEALRSTFREEDGRPVQVIGDEPRIDLAALWVEEEGASTFAEALAREAWRPFDLAAGPPFRVRILRRAMGPGGEPGGEVEEALVFAFHHLVADFHSLAVFARELSLLYEAETAGGERLPPPRAVWTDHAARLAEAASRPAGREAREFWRRRWRERRPGEESGSTLFALPVEAGSRASGRSPSADSRRAASLPVSLGPETLAGVRRLARLTGATPFAVLLGGLALALHRAAGGPRAAIPLAFPASLRRGRELAGLVGYTVNPLWIEADPGAAATGGELLAAVGEATAEALAHKLAPSVPPGEPFPFRVFVSYNRSLRRLSGRGDMDGVTAFSLGEEGAEIPLGSKLALRGLPLAEKRQEADLLIMAAEREDGLDLSIGYRTALFEPTTVARLAGHLEAVLRALAAAPDAPPAALSGLTAAEAHQLTVEWAGEWAAARAEARDSVRGRLSDGAGGGLFARLEAVAARRPDAAALVAEGETVSYGELVRRARAVAGELARLLPESAEPLVAVALPPGIPWVTAVWGALAAGAAYLPLDPAAPEARLRRVLEDARPACVLAAEGWAMDGGEGRVIRLDEEGRPVSGTPVDAAERPMAEPPRNLSPFGLFYVIYTSGSTGRPKGVEVHREGFENLLAWYAEALEVGPEERALAGSALTFDLAQKSVFAPLLAGGQLHLPPPGPYDPALLARRIGERRLRLVNTAPSAFYPILEAAAERGYRDLESLDRVSLGGEPIDRGPLAAWRAAAAERQGPQPRIVNPRIVNTYGPTEATDIVAFHAVDVGAKGAAPPIGRPVPGDRLRVVGAALETLPIGAPGELVVGGVGVSRGYRGRPGATAERFVPDPAPRGRAGGGRLYRTGDRVRRDAAGVLHYLGRTDDQVKIRGIRVEPGEAAAVLAEHPGVARAVVTARPRAGGEPGGGPEGEVRLAAYLVPDGPPEGRLAPDELLREVRAHAEANLPPALRPAWYQVLAELPLSPHGKLDRRALPAPRWDESAGAAAEADAGRPARGPVERAAAAVWGELLGLDGPTGAEADFFRLGGHSLLAARAAARLRAELKREVRPADLFAAPTPALLAERLGEAGEGAPGGIPIPRAETSRDVFPLSFAQERLYFLDRLMGEAGSAAYLLPAALEITGPLSVRALGTALAGVQARHEVLRIRIRETGERPEAVLAPATGAEAGGDSNGLPVVDLSRLDADMGQKLGRDLARREAARPFRLAEEAPMRASLLRLPAAPSASGEPPRHLFLLTLHHVAADGPSLEVLAREISRGYAEAPAGRSAPAVTDEGVTYGDFARWQRSRTREDALQESLTAWKERLADIPTRLDLPADRPRPISETSSAPVRGRGDPALALAVPFPRGLGEGVRRRAEVSGATAFMVVMAAYQAFLGRVTGARRLLVGTPVTGRDRPELTDMVGLLIDTLPVAGDLRPAGGKEPSLADLVERVRGEVHHLQRHADLPFERLVAALEGPGSVASPLFQALLAFDAEPRPRLELPGASARLLPTERAAAKLPLSLDVHLEGGELEATLTFDRALFSDTAAHRLTAQLARFTAAALARPETPVAEAPLLSPAQEHQLRREWDHHLWRRSTSAPRRPAPMPEPPMPEPPMPEPLVPEIFAARAREVPEAAAVRVDPGDGPGSLPEVWSYGELARRTGRLAAWLRKELAEREPSAGAWEPRVALVMGPGTDRLAALLAVLAAGAAYVPVEPGEPPERRRQLFADAAPALVLDGPAVQAVLAERSAGEGAEELLASEPIHADGLAYVLYTSGSTGRPKGVMISHRSLAGYLAWVNDRRLVDRSSAGEGLALPALTPLAFDASLKQSLAPLLRGEAVWLPGAAGGEGSAGSPALAPGAILRMLARRSAAALNAVPSLWRALLQAAERGEGPAPMSVRRLALGGEAAEPELLARAAAEGRELVNLYGPTEASANALAGEMEPERAAAGLPPGLGRPLPGVRLRLLDRRMRPVPPGTAGEIYLGGPGLARGYLGRPGRTAASFVPDPFAGELGARSCGTRLYGTGDLARHLPDGRLVFVGRKDRQLKVRGVRVEPGEIEAALTGLGVRLPGHPDEAPIAAAAVLAPGSAGGSGALTAFLEIAGAEEGPVPPAELGRLRAALARRLPAAYLPSRFFVLPALPRLPGSGKVDLRALGRRAGDPDAQGLPASEGREAPKEPPRNRREARLAEIWAEVLADAGGPRGEDGRRPRPEVGIHDDFFFLGGHSLLALRVLARVRESFGVELPLRALFEAPTVAALAERIARTGDGFDESDGEVGGEAGRAGARGVVPRVSTGAGFEAPLTFAQEALWLADQVGMLVDLRSEEETREGALSAYHLPAELRMEGPLEPARLAAALAEIVRRHEALRTTFHLRPTAASASEVGSALEGTVQRVEAAARQVLPVVDLGGLARVGRVAENEAARLAAREAVRPFRLESGPPARFRLLRLTPGDAPAAEHRLLATFHHLVADGASLEVFTRELAALYQGGGTLPAPAFQVPDLAVWEHAREAEEMQSGTPAEPAPSLPLPELPTDRPRRESGRRRAFWLEAPLALPPAGALASLESRLGVSRFMTLLAAFGALLGRWGAGRAFAVGAPFAGRELPGSEDLIGCLARLRELPIDLRGDPSGDRTRDRTGEPSFEDLVGRVKEGVLAAAARGSVRRKGIGPGDTAGLPRVTFSHEPRPPRAPELPGLRTSLGPVRIGAAKVDIALAAAPKLKKGELEEDRLEIRCEADAGLFDRTTLLRLIGQWERLLAAAVAEPRRPLEELSFLAPAERQQLLAELTPPGREPELAPELLLVPELFLARAAEQPDAVAVSAGGDPSGNPGPEVLTYGCLARRAGRIAASLRAAGVGRGAAVGLALPRSPELVCAALGTLLAGACFVPLPPDLPDERRERMARDARLAALLADGTGLDPEASESGSEDVYESGAASYEVGATSSAESGRESGAERAVERSSGAVGSISDKNEPVDGVDSPNLQVNRLVDGVFLLAGQAPGTSRREVHELYESGAASPRAGGLEPEELSYVLFTSGSTGVPKGVEISHRGLAGLAAWHREAVGLGPGVRVGQTASPAFDAWVWEVLPALAAGASLHLAPESARLEAHAAAAWWRERRIHVAFLPTALVETLVAEPPPEGLALRVLLFGGEALRGVPSPEWSAARREGSPGAGGPGAGVPDLRNHYGPAEASVVATGFRMERLWRAEPAPIGRPRPGLTARVLGPRLRPVPLGAPGELCLGGNALARGYRGRPGETATRFVPDPHAGPERPGARLYRTGDRVRLGADGELRFLGRVDHQVQVRGVRVELGEIEAVLSRRPEVAEAAVVFQQPANRNGGDAGEGGLLAVWKPAASAVTSLAPEAARAAERELARHLKGKLPAAMIPRRWVAVAALPRTPGGKVDRVALAAFVGHELVRAAPTPPRSELEAALVEIWARVLGTDAPGREGAEERPIGVHDDFFELGGHSLSAARVAAEIRGDFGIEVPVTLVFEAPTIAELAPAVVRALAGDLDDDAFDEELAQISADEGGARENGNEIGRGLPPGTEAVKDGALKDWEEV